MSTRATGASRLTWAAVWAQRLERQVLAAPAQDATPADIVRALCGAHAQVMSAAEMSIALRLARGSRRVVRDALWTERSLVKTVGPRGTRAVAIDHTILRLAYHLLSHETTYQEQELVYCDERRRARTQQRALAQLKALGYEVTLAPTPPAA